MARRCVLGGLVCLLFLIALFRGCGSDSPCPNEGRLVVKRGHGRILTSPDYPASYGNNRDCSWKITTESAHDVVYLYVINLTMEGGNGCPYDSLSIYDSDGPKLDRRLAKICGSDLHTKAFRSTGRHMYLRFLSDYTLSKSGFELHISAVRDKDATTTTTVPFRETTTIPFRSYPTTTSSRDRSVNFDYSELTAVFVGVGIAFLVLVCCVIACCCYRKRSSRPSVGRPATSTSSTTRANNNARAVYVVPRQHTRPAVPRPSVLPTAPPPRAQAHSNPAFSPHSEDPPSYSSLNITTVQVEMDVPPSYRESMIMTYPPSYKDVIEETPARR